MDARALAGDPACALGMVLGIVIRWPQVRIERISVGVYIVCCTQAHSVRAAQHMDCRS